MQTRECLFDGLYGIGGQPVLEFEQNDVPEFRARWAFPVGATLVLVADCSQEMAPANAIEEQKKNVTVHFMYV